MLNEHLREAINALEEGARIAHQRFEKNECQQATTGLSLNVVALLLAALL